MRGLRRIGDTHYDLVLGLLPGETAGTGGPAPAAAQCTAAQPICGDDDKGSSLRCVGQSIQPSRGVAAVTFSASTHHLRHTAAAAPLRRGRPFRDHALHLSLRRFSRTDPAHRLRSRTRAANCRVTYNNNNPPAKWPDLLHPGRPSVSPCAMQCQCTRS